MDYKHYTFDGEGYRLKISKGKTYFFIAVAVAAAVYGIWYSAKTGYSGGYIWAAICIPLALLIILNGLKRKVIIDTNTKTVTVKTAWGKEMHYPFSEFLNFETIRRRYNGVVTNRNVSIYFNQNGQNRGVFLKEISGPFMQKRADTLIAETSDLLGINAADDTLTQTKNQYR